MTEDLNTRLEHAAKGITPQTCPDERRRYLGSLRERVLVRMTVKETDNPDLDALFLDHLNDFKNYTILINGKMPQNKFISKLMSLCSQKDIKFTLINDETAKNELDSTGVLVVSKLLLIIIELTSTKYMLQKCHMNNYQNQKRKFLGQII